MKITDTEPYRSILESNNRVVGFFYEEQEGASSTIRKNRPEKATDGDYRRIPYCPVQGGPFMVTDGFALLVV